jgi:outer membrane immunogenic protein
MRKLTLAAAAAAALISAPAMSADMPVKAVYKAPPPVYTWTGCYVGGYGGGARSSARVTDLDAYAAAAPPGTETTVSNTGFIGGGTLGCDWQTGQFVFGIEADGGWMGIGGDALLTGTASGTRVGVRSAAYGDITGRLGLAWNMALLYIKGGVAFSDRLASFSTVTGSFSGVTFNGNSTGSVFGGGVEYMLSRGWSVKLEYLHFYFANSNYTVFNAVGTPFRFNENVKVDTLMLGLNWRFGGPIMAAY